MSAVSAAPPYIESCTTRASSGTINDPYAKMHPAPVQNPRIRDGTRLRCHPPCGTASAGAGIERPGSVPPPPPPPPPPPRHLSPSLPPMPQPPARSPAVMITPIPTLPDLGMGCWEQTPPPLGVAGLILKNGRGRQPSHRLPPGPASSGVRPGVSATGSGITERSPCPDLRAFAGGMRAPPILFFCRF